MKKIYLLLSLVCLSLVTANAQERRIRQIIQESRNKQITANITYDSSNRVASIERVGRSTLSFEYGDQIVISYNSENGYLWTNTLTLEDGRVIVSHQNMISENGQQEEYQYNYSGGKLMSTARYSNGSLYSNITYEWSGDNLTKIVYTPAKYPSDFYTSEFTYYDEKAPLALRVFMYPLLMADEYAILLTDTNQETLGMGCYYGDGADNLVKQYIEDDDVYDFVYEKDGNGNITKVLIYEDGDVEYTLTLTWEEGTLTGITNIADVPSQESVYMVDGRRATTKTKGLTIRKSSDGSVRKVVVK